MSSSPSRSLPGRFLDALRRLRGRFVSKILFSPRLNRWVFPGADQEPLPEDRYREFNRACFADFYEQEKMLADRPRMSFYKAAIDRHIRPGDRVIDLGTGTGILAALASRRGAAHVHAIDHSEILVHARTLAAHNHVENVEFTATHSSAFKLDAPVDVILHEQMGDYLFDEDMVLNVIDLRDRLLKPGGRILPSSFELFIEPVKVRDDRFVPFLWDLKVHGIDYSCLERERPQNSGYYHIAGRELGYVDHLLCTPEPALRIDLHTVRIADLPKEVHFTRTIRWGGRLDGFAVYFRALVDDDLTLGSSPLDPERAPNWGYRVLRTDHAEFAEGDTITLNVSAGNWADPESWRWNYQKNR